MGIADRVDVDLEVELGQVSSCYVNLAQLLFVGDEDDACLAVLQDVRALLGGLRRVERNRDGAETENGQIDDRPLVAVLTQQPDPVAGPYTQRSQSERNLLDVLQRLSGRDRMPGVSLFIEKLVFLVVLADRLEKQRRKCVSHAVLSDEEGRGGIRSTRSITPDYGSGKGKGRLPEDGRATTLSVIVVFRLPLHEDTNMPDSASFPRLLLVLISLGLVLGSQPLEAQQMTYPETPEREVTDEYHGETVTDAYRWLEDSESSEVREWEDAQYGLTRRLIDQIPEREKIRQSLESYWNATKAQTPIVRGNRYFYRKQESLENQPRLFVREGSAFGEERVLVDPNTLRSDGTVAMDWYFPSPDGSLVAYGLSEGGSERATLHVIDVATGENRDDVIPDALYASLAWSPDGSGFFYTRYPAKGSVPEGEENYSRHVYYHRLGTDPSSDPKIYGDGRAKEEWYGVIESGEGVRPLLTRSVDWSRNDVLVLDPDTHSTELIVEGYAARFFPEIEGEHLVIRTNWDAPRYRVLRAPASDPSMENWVEILPEGEGVIEEIELVGERLIVHRMVDAHSRLTVHGLNGEVLREIELPALGTVDNLHGGQDKDEMFFLFESFVYPDVVFHCNLATGELREFDRLNLDFDFAAFETKQIWFESKDGTRVPMFVTARKDVELNGDNPVLLTGYGGFNLTRTPRLRRNALLWLERGGVYVEANLRGGGEFGTEWHKAGRLANKQNVFDDFIGAAEELIELGYTKPKRLAITGRSNGGLLTGAAVTQRPDLFQAAVVGVPLLDMLRYHEYTIARIWMPEYGSADDPEQYAYLKEYSPYHNVEPETPYPAVFLTAGEKDTRVDAMHARKMAALLQSTTSSDRPVLLRIDRRAGHGQGKPLSMKIEEWADTFTFLMWQCGLIPAPADLELPPTKARERS